ncbi:MAG: insulinase family protein [Clostridia bacterium]|nr:insulinase family protein [Clostridia bacterium]
MIPKKVTVTDGVTLSYIRTNKFKTGILTFTVPFSLNRENLVYNTLLPGVLRRGTRRYPSMAALNRRLDELYATCVELRSQRIGKNLTLSLTAELLDDSYAPPGAKILEGVVELVAEILLHPDLEGGFFRVKPLEQEIRFAVDSIRGEINNTRAYAAIRCAELMHRDDPDYPTLTELEAQIQKVDAPSLTRYYQNTVLPSHLQVFYVGSASIEQVSLLLNTYFSSWQCKKVYMPVLPMAEKSTGFLRVNEPMPVSQGKLAMGFRTGVCVSPNNDRSHVMLVLNEIFGASPVSKLFMNVRERMSLCYYCSSAYNRYNGILTVSCGIDSKNEAVARQAILDQLHDIQKGQISDAEFCAALVSLENSYRAIDDNPIELQTFYGNREFFGLSGSIDECRDKLRSVTKEQIVSLAGQIELDTVFFIEGTKVCAEQEADDE